MIHRVSFIRTYINCGIIVGNGVIITQVNNKNDLGQSIIEGAVAGTVWPGYLFSKFIEQF